MLTKQNTILTESENISIELQKLEEERKRILKYLQLNLITRVSVFITVNIMAIYFNIFPFFIALLSLLIFHDISEEYPIRVSRPFEKLVVKVKHLLVKHYLQSVHPTIDYVLDTDGRNGKDILRQTGLIKGGLCKEGDTIEGHYGEAAFYLSEIHSFDAIDEKDSFIRLNSFKGLLFRVKFKRHKFPNSYIESKPSLKKKYFNKVVKRKEKYHFWYYSEDDVRFEHQLSPLFPFIEYLIEKQGDVRIRIKNSQITIMIDSKMGFLDTPKFRLWRPIVKEEYLSNMEKQLNSLFYIIETFLEGVDRSEIEDKLELHALKVQIGSLKK